MKQKPRSVKTKGSRPKVRKMWIRHPGEKVVDNKRERRLAGRELTKKAQDEYEDTK